MNRVRLQQQLDWLDQRCRSGSRYYSPWDAVDLLRALLDQAPAPVSRAPHTTSEEAPMKTLKIYLATGGVILASVDSDALEQLDARGWLACTDPTTQWPFRLNLAHVLRLEYASS
jgi:hypothetical protein